MTRWMLILLLCSPLAWADPVTEQAEDESAGDDGRQRIYRIVGDDGRVIFTDAPEQRDGVEEVEIREQNTINMVPVRPRASAREEMPAGPSYQLTITSPEDQATLRSPEFIQVTTRVSPALVRGHRMVLVQNGQLLEGMRIDWPDRGTHTLQLRVLNAKNEVLGESAPVQVFVHRPSVNQPR
jgi:hypothetical protein